MSDQAHEEAVEALAGELGPLLRSARRSLVSSASELGLGGGASLVLAEIEREPGVRARDLAWRNSIETSVLSRQLSSLVERGLVERSADPDDGRAHLLSLSEDGARELEKLRELRRGLLGSALASWSEAELEEATVVLARLRSSLVGVAGVTRAPQEETGTDAP